MDTHTLRRLLLRLRDRLKEAKFQGKTSETDLDVATAQAVEALLETELDQAEKQRGRAT